MCFLWWHHFLFMTQAGEEHQLAVSSKRQRMELLRINLNCRSVQTAEAGSKSSFPFWGLWNKCIIIIINSTSFLKHFSLQYLKGLHKPWDNSTLGVNKRTWAGVWGGQAASQRSGLFKIVVGHAKPKLNDVQTQTQTPKHRGKPLKLFLIQLSVFS